MLKEYSMLDARLKITIFLVGIIIYRIAGCSCQQAGHDFDSHENRTLEIIRTKRSVTTFKCSSNKCTNGACTPRHYEGTNPPTWCRNLQPHKSESKCEWSKSCWGSECKMESNCDQQYEDLQQGQKMTLKFKCYTQTCIVTKCQGGSCKNQNISKQDFEQKFINALPNCNDVEGQGRRKRTPGAVQGFIGYCCDISMKWGGMVVGTVRPIRR